MRFEEVLDFLESGDVPLFRVFFIYEGKRCRIADILENLPAEKRKQIRRLIRYMMIVENFKSPHLTWRIKAYPYGEVKPPPHRFFFFIRCGKNIVFFDYREKKTDSLSDNVYKSIDRKREIYVREFERFCAETS